MERNAGIDDFSWRVNELCWKHLLWMYNRGYRTGALWFRWCWGFLGGGAVPVLCISSLLFAILSTHCFHPARSVLLLTFPVLCSCRHPQQQLWWRDFPRGHLLSEQYWGQLHAASHHQHTGQPEAGAARGGKGCSDPGGPTDHPPRSHHWERWAPYCVKSIFGENQSGSQEWKT